VKIGKEALELAMEALVWFMRDRGSMKKQARKYDSESELIVDPREDIFSVFADARSHAFMDRKGEMEKWDNVALTIFRDATPYFGTPWSESVFSVSNCLTGWYNC
jgi:hypothetical protein